MASAAPSVDGGGDDKPLESAPANLDPPSDPQRNGEPPAAVASSGDEDMSRMGMLASSGDDDVSTMGTTSGDDVVSTMGTAKCGAKRALWLPSRRAPCRRCERRKMILRGIDPGPPQSDDELPSAAALPDSPVPGTGMELPDARALGTNGSPSAAGWCASCEFRKKIHRDRRLRRNGQLPAPPPLPSLPVPPLDDESLWPRLRPRREKKRPLSVEQERGYRECDVGKKLMRHKWGGLHDKWAGLRRDSALKVPDFGGLLKKLTPWQGAQTPGFGAAAGGRDLLEMMMLDVQKMFGPLQGAQKPGFGAATGDRELLDMMMLDVQKMFGPLQGAQKPGFGAAAGERELLDMMMLDVQKTFAPLQGAQKPGFGAAAGERDLQGMMMLDVQKNMTLLQRAQKPSFGAATGERDLLDMMMLDVQKKLEPPQGAQKPGFGAAAGGHNLLEKIMLDVQKKVAPLQGAQKPGFDAATGGHDLLEKMMLDVQKRLVPLQGAQKPGFGAAAGGHDLLEKMMLQKALHVDGTRLALQQEAQKPSPSAAARVDVLHQKLAQMTKVLTKVLREGSVLQVSTKLIRLLCPDVGLRAAAGCLDGIDWGLIEEAIDNLVNQTGEGMQDIVKTVIPKVFSKEILYDLIMACVGQYPKLLEDVKGKLTPDQHKKYQKQLDLMVNLTMVYDNDPEDFSKIMKLMCKIGECGPLPRAVIDHISPGVDPSTMEQLYTGMLELLHNVDRASPVDANPTSK